MPNKATQHKKAIGCFALRIPANCCIPMQADGEAVRLVLVLDLS